MKRERRWTRRVFDVVDFIAVTVRDRLRDVFVLFVSFLVRLVTVGLLGSRSSRVARDTTTTEDARATERNVRVR
jgi:hypothetical protein